MLKHIPNRPIILLAGDVLLIIISFYLSYAIRHEEYIDVFSSVPGASIFSIFIFIFVFYIGDIYGFEGKFNNVNFAVRLAVAILAATGLIAATIYIFSLWHFSRIVFILNIVFIYSFMFIWHFTINRLTKNGDYASRVLIVGAGRTGRGLYNILHKNDNYEIVGFLDDDLQKKGKVIGSSAVIGNTGLLPSLVKDKNVDKVIVTITHNASNELLKKIISIKFSGIETYDMPAFYENITGKIPILHLTDRWFGYANIYGVKKNLYNTKIKKILDKIVAVLVLVVTFPIAILAVLAIKLSSKGSVFFRQERVGEGIKTFEVIKFRTMKSGSEEERALSGSENDLRITKTGKILRFFRIDEIPQLWNVLKGNMSIVGPRALIKEEVDEFSEKIPYFSLRHSVKPGITGWAQVNYKHGANIEDGTEKLQFDLFYIKNLSPVLDFHIFLKTMKVVLFGKGAR